MRVRVLKPVRVTAQAGTEVDLPEFQARLLIKTGAAVKSEEKAVEKAVKAPAETAEKKTQARKKKKEE